MPNYSAVFRAWFRELCHLTTLLREHRFTSFQPDTLFDVICSGCDASCTGCSVPGDAPGCAAEIERSNSTGGDVTLATLLIDPGCWRASNTSMEVLTCYNENACRGGLTGAPDYCRSGYEGPCENFYGLCSFGNILWKRAGGKNLVR